MNIIVLAHRLPFPANKGEKIRTFHQIKFLAELGHKISVLAPEESKFDHLLHEQFNEKFEQVQCELFAQHNKLMRLIKGIIKGESLSVANFYSKPLAKAFDKSLLAGDIDAVLCTSSAMVKYIDGSSTLQTLKQRPKLIMDFMDLDSDKWRQYSDKSVFPMRWLYKREQRLIANAERKSQKLFDACYLIAKAEVDMFKSVHGNSDKVHVLGNGLETKSFFPPKLPLIPVPASPIFIFTGVMDYKPNVDAVIWFVENCWEEIISRFEYARFIVAGMNPTDEVSKLAKQKGIEVTGFVDEILPYYHQANYFVAPFRLARGVQNKVLQAFACGLPVITTPMGAEGIPCIDGKHVLLANSAKEFISQIETLQNDPELGLKIAGNALNLIQEEFSWEGKLKPLVLELNSH